MIERTCKRFLRWKRLREDVEGETIEWPICLICKLAPFPTCNLFLPWHSQPKSRLFRSLVMWSVVLESWYQLLSFTVLGVTTTDVIEDDLEAWLLFNLVNKMLKR